MFYSFIRIKALIERHLLLTFRTVDRILNIVYWPLITIVVWGGNMIWMEEKSAAGSLINAVFFAMVLWQVVYRVSLEIANSLMEEIISRNLVNLFATPVSLYEWIIATLILGIMNMALITLFGGIMLKLIFSISLLQLGWILILSIFSLLLTGVAIGYIICAIFITWGRAVRDFMHALVWLIGVFSAIYYPLHVMPESLQLVARLVPSTYIFEIVRGVVQTGHSDHNLVIKCLMLNVLYIVFSLALFVIAFNNSKKYGLSRLE